MTLPSVPTDSLYKALFIGGIALFVFIESQTISLKEKISISSFEESKVSKRLLQAGQEISTLLDKQVKDYESRVETLKEQTEYLKKGYNPKFLVDKIGELNFQIKKREEKISDLHSEAAKLQNEFDLLHEQVSDQIKELKNKEANDFILYSVAFICFIVGLYGWLKSQSYQNKILYKQYIDAIKEDYICQSCTMLLRLDKNRKEGSLYCSHCHDGNNFTEPDLSFDKMKERIKKQMSKQGIGWYKRWSHLESLKDLERWKKHFKWEEGEA